MTAKTLEQEVQTIGPNNFVGLVSQLRIVDGVPQMSPISEIQSARKRDEKLPDGRSLRDVLFYGGNGCVYGIDEKDEVWLYATNAANNPGLKNPAEFACQLKTHHNNYFLGLEESNTLRAKAKTEDGSVVAINLSQLEKEKRLTRYDDEFSGIEVKTEILKNGREAFLKEYGETVTKLFDGVEGEAIYGEEGIGDLLLKEEKKVKRIGVLTPNYVKDALKGKARGIMLARASFVGDFDGISDVGLSDWDLGDHGHARGVVKESAEGGARKIMDYEAALKEVDKIAPKGTPFNPIMVDFVNKIYGQ